MSSLAHFHLNTLVNNKLFKTHCCGLLKTQTRVFLDGPFVFFFCCSLEKIVYLLSCLFCFVWTRTCFFKTLARVECHLINGGYNSWKPSQCFPVGFIHIYTLRAACSSTSLLLSSFASPYLHHTVSLSLHPLIS